MKDVGILKQALPYFRRYKNKTFVIKLGGGILKDKKSLDNIAQDISLLYQIGIKVIVVHGGGYQATELSKKLGIIPKIIEGRRITDEKTLEVVKMVLAGKINHEILTVLKKYGVKCVGLSGIDGNIIKAKRREPVKHINEKTGKMDNLDFGYVGDITGINNELIMTLLEHEYMPVVSSLGDDGQGNILNINADTVASNIAISIKAFKLIIMTDVNGILSNPEDSTSTLYYVSREDILKLIKEGMIRGGMLPKINESLEAVENGVKRVHIINGSTENALLIEIFTNRGVGTAILADGEQAEDYTT